VATYNINGSRGSLSAIFAQAKIARIDILLYFHKSSTFMLMENIYTSAK
jgi:hypothetical protein